MTEADIIPVILVTGFLGSGKTTLLQRLLLQPELADTAVIINEFGEVGIDHHIVRQVTENIVLLPSGCVCCTLRDDLGVAMRDLIKQRDDRRIPRFNRLVIETTGLADPVPIVHTLMTDPVLDRSFCLQTIITTIDAVNGDRHLTAQPESVKQIAVADRVVITKTDLTTDSTLASLAARIRRMNPSAMIDIAQSRAFRSETLMNGGSYDLRNASDQVRTWINDEAYRAGQGEHDDAHVHAASHDKRIVATCFQMEAIDWTAFSIWLTMLLHSHGSDILRVKGLLNVSGQPGPVIVHGVQHILHPPVHLASWPDPDRRSRLVFITRDIQPAMLEQSLWAFNHAAADLESSGQSLNEKPALSGAGGEVGRRPYRRAGGLAWMK